MSDRISISLLSPSTLPSLNDRPAVSVAGIIAWIPLMHPAVVVLMVLRRG
jgi:hypothetical protein